MIQIILFFAAYILFLPLSLLNYFFVENKKGYFLSSALNLDKFGNREFRTLWNKTLITEKGYKFGNIEETISAIIGINKQSNSLTKIGNILYKVLNKIEKNHCEIAANIIIKK